ncbi:hypothetical protein BVI434_2420002 [Burkholderia vietnamiensis]|nr:hypothetical protein BVI434_2420002 [Burkholderia vietnamiensis]
MPDDEPAVRAPYDARHGAGRRAVPACRPAAARGLARAARRGCAVAAPARRARVVGQSASRERREPVDDVGGAGAAHGARRNVRQPAGRRARARRRRVRGRRRAVVRARVDRFRGNGRTRRRAGSRDRRRHVGRASGRRARPAGVGAAAARARLALAARALAEAPPPDMLQPLRVRLQLIANPQAAAASDTRTP